MEPTQNRRKLLPVDELPIRSSAPVPRPRPTVPVDRKLSRPLLPTVTGQNGPLTANPGFIRCEPPYHSRQFPDDINIKQYRALWTRLHREAQRLGAMGSTPKPKSWRAVKLWGGLERQCSWDILPSLPLPWVGIGWSHSVVAFIARRCRRGSRLEPPGRDTPQNPSSEIQALLLHKHCGLISDPRWGDANLVFPFAVYEAKGWGGDPREARRQACSAGAVYLDLLEVLTKRPGKHKPGKIIEDQTPESRNTQVFVFTSFGAHWHILVGYKRLRLKQEYAGHEGMSKSVYIFQRIWSARVVTEKKAWELLSLVDQIHLWGVTDHREFVIRHLKPWHRYAERCYARDVEHMLGYVDTAGWLNPKTHARQWSVPQNCIRLPEWMPHLINNSQQRYKLLISRAAFQIKKAFLRHQGTAKARAGAGEDIDAPVDGGVCVIDDKGRYGTGFRSVDEADSDDSTPISKNPWKHRRKGSNSDSRRSKSRWTKSKRSKSRSSDLWSSDSRNFDSRSLKLEEVKVKEFQLEEVRLKEFRLEEVRLKEAKVEEFRLEKFRIKEVKVEEFQLEEVKEFRLEEVKVEEVKVEEFRLEEFRLEEVKVEEVKVEEV
ncbi:uncharacterized protein C8A04DRAFT_38683 [Dichotomopilus funicola]|uniref:Uncharacterized protein n=1 Tax=Dichotomopilus funicola TaxID=1934379 RepID=A0AAN6V029_9PEZI|nr:hypothetical protein C8A04DRAFT_38683 [Dichotomopilus funicola]